MLMIAEIMGIPEPDRPRIFDLIDTSFRSSDPQNDLTDDDNLAATIALYQYAQDLGADKRHRSLATMCGASWPWHRSAAGQRRHGIPDSRQTR